MRHSTARVQSGAHSKTFDQVFGPSSADNLPLALAKLFLIISFKLISAGLSVLPSPCVNPDLTALELVAMLNMEEVGWICLHEDEAARKSCRLECMYPTPDSGRYGVLWERVHYKNKLLCTWVACAAALNAAQRRKILLGAPARRLAKLETAGG